MNSPSFDPGRRRLSILASLGGLLAWSRVGAQAPAWPSKPVRLVVALAPGGLADVLSRTIESPLSKALGQQVVIDNRGGAGGNVGGVEVARNGGDGHTFLIAPSTLESVNPLIFPRMPFDPQKDLMPVALLANSHLFLLVRPTLPVNTLKEFLAYAKAHPGTLSYGSAGNGTTPHLAGELLKQGAGITATHVAYRGAAPAIQDVLSGQIDFAFGPATVLSHVKAGKLKLLAVASRQRSPSAPDAPTFVEAGVNGVFADSLFGIYAPTQTPVEVINRMNREVNKVLAQPDIKARFQELGAEAAPRQPAEYKAMVQAETSLFTEIVKSRGITVD
jgi:tripartite-type tricarboxylate transporter receptor subunit TctC